MNMKMKKHKPRNKPTYQYQVVKQGLPSDKAHMRKEEKTVAHSVLPSDMSRIAN